MSNFFYDAQVKRVLTQFMRLMSSFSYKDAKGNLTTIPVRYGDMNRQVASIINKNSENIVQSAPFIACYIKNIQYDRARLQDPTFVSKLHIRERAYDLENREYLNTQGANYTVERLMPSPYTITFAADIWTTNLDQKFQIWEQIAMLFNPSMEIQMTDNYVDWTSLSTLELLPESQFETRNIPQGVDTAISVANMVFSAPIWISPPAKVKKLGIITKIIANIFDESKGTIAASYTDAGLTDMFTGQTPRAQVVITPGNYELLVLNNQATLIPTKSRKAEEATSVPTAEHRASWLSILDLYPGKFTAGLSQIRLSRPDNYEIVARATLEFLDETIMNLVFDPDTIPANTLISDPAQSIFRGTVDAIIDPQTFNPGSAPVADTRYLILEDINPNLGTPGYDGPEAWKNSNGSDFTAHANDIICWNGSSWDVIFDSQQHDDVMYITNAYTGIQYKWDGFQWTKSFEGIYDAKSWRLIL